MIPDTISTPVGGGATDVTVGGSAGAGAASDGAFAEALAGAQTVLDTSVQADGTASDGKTNATEADAAPVSTETGEGAEEGAEAAVDGAVVTEVLADAAAAAAAGAVAQTAEALPTAAATVAVTTETEATTTVTATTAATATTTAVATEEIPEIVTAAPVTTEEVPAEATTQGNGKSQGAAHASEQSHVAAEGQVELVQDAEASPVGTAVAGAKSQKAAHVPTTDAGPTPVEDGHDNHGAEVSAVARTNAGGVQRGSDETNHGETVKVIAQANAAQAAGAAAETNTDGASTDTPEAAVSLAVPVEVDETSDAGEVEGDSGGNGGAVTKVAAKTEHAPVASATAEEHADEHSAVAKAAAAAAPAAPLPANQPAPQAPTNAAAPVATDDEAVATEAAPEQPVKPAADVDNNNPLENLGRSNESNAAARARAVQNFGSVQERIDHIAEQLATRMRLSSAAGGSQVHLQLRPRELGEVQVNMTVRHGLVTANVVVDRVETGRIMTDNLEELRRSLESQGLSIDQLAVNVRSGHDLAGQMQDARERAAESARSRRSDSIGAVQAGLNTPGLTGDREVNPDDLHDGAVSVLA
jgi:flagellar hook-length control protein FliK